MCQGEKNIEIDALDTMRHSCAHVMAAAVLQLWPDAKFGVGPVIDNGFYYDILTTTPITETDLAKIETLMRKIKKKKHKFEKNMVPIAQAKTYMSDSNQPFKVELLDLLDSKGTTAITKDVDDDKAVAIEKSDDENIMISLYTTGDFVDLCRGPHVDNTSGIGHFKLHRLAGAYWRGDEKNPQLQRIYGLCFEKKEEVVNKNEEIPEFIEKKIKSAS